MEPTLWSKIHTLLQYNPDDPLIFTNGLFLFLFLGFICIYTLLRHKTTPRILYVVAFSLYFYYKTSGWYLFLLIFVSLSDFLLARLMAQQSDQRRRKWCVAASLIINLALLGYYKYTNFLGEIFTDLFGGNFEFKDIFLPIGISFFIFQSLSYVIDVYRGKIKPLTNYSHYLFYISFFPQLVAGPIVRATDFIPQILRTPIVTRAMFGEGILLIVTGLIKKAVISDWISLNFVDRVFDNPLLYSGFENLMGVWGYALQIYCDFSGYSDMAIGLALLLGFRFPKNFDTPYKSATITEFWRRWHMSLSFWLKDYLYISLGGNRKGRARTYINLMLTMLLGGLWHGAALKFVVWGGLHGTALAVHKFMMSNFSSFKASGDRMSLGRRIVGVLITFNFVCFCWIFFRADSFEKAMQVISQIFTAFNASVIPQFLVGYRWVFVLIVVGYLMHLVPSEIRERIAMRSTRVSLMWQVIALVAAVWVVMQLRNGEIQPFIYFQF